MSPNDFTRSDVQNMLDEAQLEVDILFANNTILRDQLKLLFQDVLMECNSQHVDPMKSLYETLYNEYRILDAYNRHRLGNAVTAFNKRVLDPEGAVEYLEEDNIPEQDLWFPLRKRVKERGGNITAPPIYQLESTEEHSQEHTADPGVLVDENVAPTTKNSATVTARGNSKSRKNANKRSTAKGKMPTGFGSPHYDKLKNAPSAWLDLPHGNLTLAETLAFIPHAIKSYDIMDRFLYNGALSGTLADIINQYRDMPKGPVKGNSVYRMMKGPMDHRGKNDPVYKKWTVAKHAAIPKPAGFDPASVSVAGFSTPLNFNSRERAAAASRPPSSIPFRDMVNGVKVMPSGYDALDLTRCIQYCVNHSDSSWVYPQDFQRLIAHLGGAATVYPQHQDDAAISRHTSEKKLKNAKRAAARQRDNNGRLVKQQKSFVVDSDEEEMLDEEPEEDVEGNQDDFDFDALDDDDDELVTATKQVSQCKNASEDNVSDEDDVTPRIRNSSKRKRTAAPDNEDYDGGPRRRMPKRSKKPPPKIPARRSTRTQLSRLYKEVLPDDIESEPEEDAYAGPRRRGKKAVVATRSSGRSQRFSGSYNFEKALDVEDYEDDEDDDGDEMEHPPTPDKRILTPAEMRMVGRNRGRDADDAVEGDESDVEEETSGDDEEFDS